MNPPDRMRRSLAYREGLRKKSLDRLNGTSCLLNGDQFLIDDRVAEQVAEALATKNPGQMRRAVGDSVDRVCAATMEAPLETFTDEWNEALSAVYNRDVTLYGLLTSSEAGEIRVLRQSLHDSRSHQLTLQTDSYIRLLHTIAIATMPDEGFRDRHATNQRERKKTSRAGVFAMAVNILDSIASREPGLRRLREGILDDEQTSPLDVYLSRLQQSETAKIALADIIDFPDKEAVIAEREVILAKLRDAEPADYNEELKTHLLSWEILPHSHDDSESTKRRLKERAKDLAKTPKARERAEQAWDETRLDALFMIAHQEADKGREVEVYISSAFNNSQEFYVAVEFSHSNGSDAKIVIADNPMSDNAIYLVDEEHTTFVDDTNRHKWRQVLGASKKIARLRGARRRFHVGEWQHVAEQFCMRGVGQTARSAAGIRSDVEAPVAQPEITIGAAEQAENLKEAPQAEPTIDVREVRNKLAAARRQIDELYKTIIDNK